MKLLSEKCSIIHFASLLWEEQSFCFCVIQDDSIPNRVSPKVRLLFLNEGLLNM